MKLILAIVAVLVLVSANSKVLNTLQAKTKTDPQGFLPKDAPCCDQQIRFCKVCIDVGDYSCERENPYCETERGGYRGRKADCERNHCDEGEHVENVRVPQFTLTPAEDYDGDSTVTAA